MSDYSTSSDATLSPSVCDVFQQRLYHHYPQYRGKLSQDQLYQLQELAKTITLKTNSAAIWQSIESNPISLMYFHHKLDRIHHPSGKAKGMVFSTFIFIMGAVWSWGVNEMDPTLVHLGSLLVGLLGPVAQRGLEHFRQKKTSSTNFRQPDPNLPDPDQPESKEKEDDHA